MPRATLEADGEARVGDGGTLALHALPLGLARVRIAGATLAAMTSREARVDFLAVVATRLSGDGALTIDLAIAEGVPPWGRLLLDAPRALLPRLGLAAPGTRHDGREPRHVYHTSTELEEEGWMAGLALRDHRAGVLHFARATANDERPPRPSALADAPLLRALARAEMMRRRSPREALRIAREEGARAEARSRLARVRLHARIGWLDGFVPPGPNCLRRVLAETMLDRGAANEKVVLSLDVASTGHAHFPSDPQGPPRRYDVAFEV